MKRILSISIVLLLVSPAAFAAIALRANGGQVSANTTSVALTKPTGTVAGDLMIANIAEYDSSNTVPTACTSTGWTQLSTAAIKPSGSGTRGTGVVLYKKADGTEGTTITFSGCTSATSVTGDIIAYSGVNTTTPFDATPATAETASGATSTSLAAVTATTTATANAMVILFAQSISTNTWSAETTVTAGALSETAGYDVQGAATQPMSLMAATLTKAAAGTTGAGSATLSATGYSGGVLVALKPAVVRHKGSVVNE